MRSEIRRRANVPKIARSIRVVRQDPVKPVSRAVVLSVVRDGEPFLDAFLDYYRARGLKEFVFLDNDSNDGTVKRLCREPGVSVFESRLPFGRFNVWFRQYLVETSGRGRWCLAVDIDEWFDWPWSNQTPLNRLLDYLEQCNFSAVAAQMLDMFPDGDIIQGRYAFPEAHRYYDQSAVRKAGYPCMPVCLPNGVEISIHLGGVRGEAFGLGSMYLTKHPLFYGSGRFCYETQHLICGASVADFTAVLRHYKFSPDFAERAQRAVREKQYFNASSQYREYLRVIRTSGQLMLYGPNAREFRKPEDLLETGFLVGSERFLRFCTDRPPGVEDRR